MNNLNIHNESEEVLKHLGTLVNYLKSGNFDSVIKEGKKFIAEFPDTIFLYICIAVAYIESERFEDAITFLKEAEKKFPDNFEILFQLAKAYEKDHDLVKAIQYYYKSFDATPAENKKARSDCYNDIGAILFSLGKEEEAAKVWKEGLVIDPANTLLKDNLNQSISDEAFEAENFADVVYSDFAYYQECQYLDAKGRINFESEKESENFRVHIDEAFLKEVVPRFEEIETMSEDEMIEFYQDIEIDFTKPVNDSELPEFGDKIKSHLQNVFPYLPDDGLLVITLVLPALEYSGISEKKLNNFIAQTETPDARETQILKWAYELGTNVIEFTKIENPEQKEISYLKIIGILNQELVENDSLIVLDYIFDRISGEDEDEDEDEF